MTIAPALEDLRRRLLDLTRRNRLLNLPPASATVLRLVDERPAQVWRLLVDDERTLRLLAREEAPPALAARLEAAVAAAGARGEDPAGPLALPPAPPDEPAVAARHLDRALQTAFDGKALDARLLRLDRAARTSLDEQGANLLHVTLGAVDWRETPDGPVCRAPLLFLPVALERASVTARHVVAPFDDDLVVNPCLVELLRRDARTTLPDFHPDEEGFDVVAWLSRARATIEAIPGWAYVDEVTLGLYAFAKYLLWRDLDPTTWPDASALASHPLVRLLLGTPDPTFDPGPGAPARETLDAAPADAALHVVDADASQAAVVAAARAGSSLVVDGPPGTGKSQTIANLIAGCLADGKRVLFVAEKAAALDVVRRRLEAAGLADFLLELHSRKASKRAVAERLGRALDHAQAPATPPDPDPGAYGRARDAVVAVHHAIHGVVAPLGWSPYQAVCRLAALAGAPVAAAEIADAATWTPARLEAARDLAAALDRRRERVPDPATHPWRGLGLAAVDDATRRRVAQALADVPATVARARATTATLARRLGSAPPRSPADARGLLAAGRDLAASTALDASTASDPAWAAAAHDLAACVAHLETRATARATWARVFRDDAEAQPWEDVRARRRAHGGSVLRWLRPSWHRDRARIRAASLAGAPRAAATIDAALDALVRSAGDLRDALATGTPHAALLGAAWRGPATAPADVRARCAAAAAAAGAIAAGVASADAVRALVAPDARAALAGEVGAAEAAVADLLRVATSLVATLATTEDAWFLGPATGVTFDALAARHAALVADLDGLDDMAAVVDARRRAEAAGLATFVAWTETREAAAAPRGSFADALERLVLRAWTDAALAALPALASFRGDDHAERVRRFAAADRAAIERNRTTVVTRLLARRPEATAGVSRETKLGLLKAQVRLKRGHLPIRRLLERAGDVVQAVTPCFLMSPLSVAHHLAPGAVAFDVVVFDEASQVEPADALGAVARGSQVVLFGDERQLPPTSFFARIEGGDEGLLDEDDAAAGRLESVLSLAIARLPAKNRAPLSWHYRSRDPSLVEFSNRRFYDGALVTFPGPRARREDVGVFFRPVEPGTYRRGAGQSNPAEARAVAQAVLAHAAAWVRAGGGPSLGVGAMSVAQQQAIEDEVDRLRRADATRATEPFFATDREEPFFVKNLETIQGDERDVVYLSVGYGRDEAGRLTMNFGPLNQAQGWRRLNVLVTRARTRVEVFSSLRADDLRVTDASPPGVAALKAYLAYAEHGADDELATRATRTHDAAFEAELAAALAARGFTVHAQVGTGAGAVDLAVVDPDRPGRYLLGIEADGAPYRLAATARDRDRLRQEVLARMGWRLERVWSVDWLRRRRAVVDRLVARLDEERERARAAEAAPAPPSAPAPAAAPAQPAAAPAPSPATVVAADALPAGVVAYPTRDPTTRGTADDLVAARPARIAAWLATLVTREAPIHVEEALRALAAAHGTKATARPREAFERGLADLVATGRCTRRGDFLWPPDRATPAVRWRGGDCPVVDPDLVAPEELDAAVRTTLAVEFGASREGLVTATIRRFGFPRGGPRLRAAVEAAIDRLLASGEVVPDPHGDLVLAR